MSWKTFEELINKKARLPLNYAGKSPSVVLTEPEEPDSKVEIRGLPEDAIVLKVDNFPAPTEIFTGARGECKRADYAIIADEEGKKRVLIIELKRANSSDGKDIVRQLKGAACFIKYCGEVANSFYNCKELLKGYQFRYISFVNTHIRKRKTRIECKDSKHHSPEQFLKLHYAEKVWYNQLAGA